MFRSYVHLRDKHQLPVLPVALYLQVGLDGIGIDVTKEFPKPLTDAGVRSADVVVTMGCGDACPVYPGKRYLDWQLDDPAGQGVDAVRPIRDEIEQRVRGLLAELGIPATT